VLAVALTMGTMNVYISGSSKLIASLALEGALPRWLAGDAHRSVPRRPLVMLAIAGVVLLGALVAGFSSTDALIRATSACFIGVYVLALLSAVLILTGRTRVLAALTFALIVVLGVFSGWFLAVPLVAAVVALGIRRASR
jgi:amino acid efflux transporter